MLALLSPRLWISLALACALMFSHFTAYRHGKGIARAEYESARAAAADEAQRIEALRQSAVDLAAQQAAKREAAVRADAARARSQLDGLRGDLQAVRERAGQSEHAARQSVAALSDVFEQCGKRYSELAEVADRHASDSLKLQQAWPK